MVRKVIVEAECIEVYVSSVQTLVFALVMEAIFCYGIYFFWVRVRDYVFVTALSIFSLAIASGMWPMINSVLNGNRMPQWAASRTGIELPAQTTTWTKMRPPVVHEWRRIKKVLLVEKLTYASSEGRATTANALVVLFTESQIEANELGEKNPFEKVWTRVKQGHNGRYRLLAYPKKFRADILNKLRELAPDSVRIEELQRYELA